MYNAYTSSVVVKKSHDKKFTIRPKPIKRFRDKRFEIGNYNMYTQYIIFML